MAAVSTSLLLAAGGLAAAGHVADGKTKADQAEFQAKVNEQQAGRERLISGEQEKDFRKVQSSNLAERRAAMGASGVDLSSGSALLVPEDFAAEVELQARRIRSGGEVKATRLQQQAELLRNSGQTAQRQGYARAGASLLGGAAKAYG